MTLGDRAIWFINNLTLTDEFLGQPVKLRAWQEKIVRDLHEQRDDGKTRIRRALLMLPRKQGKTQLAAFLGCNHLLGTGKVGQSCVLAACDRKTAQHTFNKIKTIVEADRYLSRQCRIYNGVKKIEVPRLGNTLAVLSSEGKRQHGENPSLVVFDEVWNLGAHRELYDALSSSFGARSEYLFLIISTQGNSRESIIYEQYEYACKVRDGVIEDPEFYSYLAEAPHDSDWTKEETWHQAMPGLGDFVSLDFIRSEFKKAKESPAEESKFRQFYLNQVVASEAKFFSSQKWAACGEQAIDLESMKGQPCFAGMDLASVEDLAAFVLIFLVDDCFHVFPFFWCPKAAAERRAVRGDSRYLTWARHGYLNLTEGETIDYQVIEDKIIALSTEHDIQSLWADQYNANHLCNNLYSKGGIKVGFISQSARGLNAPTKFLKKLVIDGKLRHGNHPVLNWMASNVCAKEDRNQNIILSKPTQAEKIDGIVALVDALGAAMSTYNLGDYAATIAESEPSTHK